jgi:hypothetical protein
MSTVTNKFLKKTYKFSDNTQELKQAKNRTEKLQKTKVK